MDEDRLAEELRSLARQFAPIVVGKSPCEIARILLLAHRRWAQVQKEYLQDQGAQDADVHEKFTRAADDLTAAILEQLPPSTHDHVMQLFHEIREKSRFDRLLQGVYLGGW